MMIPSSWVFENVWWMTWWLYPRHLYGHLLRKYLEPKKHTQKIPKTSSQNVFGGRGIFRFQGPFSLRALSIPFACMIPRMKGKSNPSGVQVKITRQDLRSKDSHLCRKYVIEVVVYKIYHNTENNDPKDYEIYQHISLVVSWSKFPIYVTSISSVLAAIYILIPSREQVHMPPGFSWHEAPKGEMSSKTHQTVEVLRRWWQPEIQRPTTGLGCNKKNYIDNSRINDLSSTTGKRLMSEASTVCHVRFSQGPGFTSQQAAA